MRNLLHFAVAAVLVSTVLAQSSPPRTEVIFTDDSRTQGRLEALPDGGIRIHTASQFGEVSSAVPLERIKRIDFSLSETERQVLTEPERADEETARALWQRLEPYAHIPSDAARAGSAYATVLLRSGDAEKSRQASVVIDQLARNTTHDPELATGLRVMQITAAIAQNELDAARTLIEQLTENATEDAPETLRRAEVQLHLIDADLARADLEALVEEWPKWELMPEKIEERRQLIARSLRGYLRPAALYPEFSNLTAEGLSKAVSLYESLGLIDEAQRRATELIEEYPDAPDVQQARNFLTTHPLTETDASSNPSNP